VFANGGNEKIFLSSADWMIRNLDRRVEVTFPIYDPKLQKELKEFLDLQWADNVKARILDESLSNPYRPRKGDAIRSQAAFYELLKKRTLGEESREAKPPATA
jgi:polyphosphate kinase